MMKILVACEESQAVTIELRKLGHEAYSCDIEPTSGNHPEWHLQQDVIPQLSEKWDMIIAFPPCTYLTYAGTKHWNNPGRAELREDAAEFFMQFANSDCPKVIIENPVGYMNTIYRKPDQIIQPYWFADDENSEDYVQKRTCLWLKGVNPLQAKTDPKLLPKPKPMYICQGEKKKGKAIGWCEGMKGIKGGQKERAKARSKTFPGIARAMAEQWTR